MTARTTEPLRGGRRKVPCKVAPAGCASTFVLEADASSFGDCYPMITKFRRHRARLSRGQSLVEFALVLPLLLLVLLGGIDFGRVFLGWVNLNNTARIAANFAANNATKFAAGSGPLYDSTFDAYFALIQRDATAINCTLPPKASFPAPTFPSGTALGSPAHVAITCKFGLITPILSSFLGSPMDVSASSDFPVRTGVIAGAPTGGGGGGVNAGFNISPTGGIAPQTITFTDTSSGGPTTYSWDFDGDGSPDSTTSGTQTFEYSIPGIYQASLTVSNGLSTASATRTITISAPPGPVVSFTALPASGNAPLLVTFTNASTGSPTLTYLWDLGDGSPTVSTMVPAPHSYAAGTYTVKLTVTDGFAQSNSAQRTITVSTPKCVVPDFTKFTTADGIQAKWNAAGFTTTVIFNPIAPPDYDIKKQSLKKGDLEPCSTAVQTVSK